jgi:hypothetical protein
MRISRKQKPGSANYSMMGEKLEEVTGHKYLGVHIENNLKWNKQTKLASDKATRVLNFIRRNFHNCSKAVKEKLYQTLVRPHLEYASTACNPVSKENKKHLEMVQRRAARFVLSDYGRKSSVNNMLKNLNWNTLEQRRENQRLCVLHKIIHGGFELDINRYTTKKVDRPRRTHDQQYQSNSNFVSTSQFSTSYFPLTISSWNQLPQSTVNIIETNAFKRVLLETGTATTTTRNKH